MTKLQAILLAIAAAALTAVLTVFIIRSSPATAEPEDADQAASKTATAGDQSAVQIGEEAQRRIGITTEVLHNTSFKPEVTAYGTLEEDPELSFTLRAPIAGTIEGGARRAWPALGEHLNAGTVIGGIRPRFTPAERVSLASQLATVQADERAAQSAVDVDQAAYNRARTLNADNKNMSDQAVEDAAARLTQEQTKLRAAMQTRQEVEAALNTRSEQSDEPLHIERSGEIVSLPSKPGESIEAGSVVTRVADYDELLARIYLPPGERVTPTLSDAELVPVGFGGERLPAHRIAIGPATDPKEQGQVLLFRLRNQSGALRPGLAVTAYLRLAVAAQAGVVVPLAAVLRYQGSAFVYIETQSGQFTRRDITLDQPTAQGYFTRESFHAGERVVVAGAQAILSEQYKAKLGDVD